MKATKKLIGAVVALIAALAVSVGATFAWFTSSNTAKVNQFSLNVKSETGDLFIGLKTGELSQGFVNYTPGDVKLSDVTLSADKSFKKRATNTPGATAETAATTSDYVQFQLFFKSSANMDVYLNTGSEVTCEPDTSNDITIYDTTAQSTVNGSSYGAAITGGKLAASAANAVRISFSTTTAVDSESDKIWEPNADQGYNENNLAADYEKFLQDGKWPTPGTPNAASSVVGNVEGLGVAQETAKILTLSKDVESSVYVTIWLEGTDGDCLNSIFSDVIKTTLVFIGQSKG